MAKSPHALLISDSRAFSFNKYKKPITSIPYKAHYIIKKGGTIESLTTLAVDFLKTDRIPHDKLLIVKIAVGINNIVSKTKQGDSYILTHSGTGNALQELEHMRNAIHTIIPNAIISFITVPPVHFQNNLE